MNRSRQKRFAVEHISHPHNGLNLKLNQYENKYSIVCEYKDDRAHSLYTAVASLSVRSHWATPSVGP
eukprot:6503352-Prymnesium_polylepis.2